MHNVLKQSAEDRNLLRAMADESERSWQRMLHRGPGNRKIVAEQSEPPANFHFPYLVGRPTPYHCCDGDGREHLSGGVLQADQVVWLEKPLDQSKLSRHVTAFTPSAGMIRLDRRGLSATRPQR